MLRPIGVFLTSLALALFTGQAVPASELLWIGRPAAQAYLPALQRASDRTDLPVALIAELIGQESGFQNVKNPKSTASGFGQQIDGNGIMRANRLDKRVPAESIMGAAIELKARLATTGSLSLALKGYGTTAGLSAARRQAIDNRFALAAVEPSHVPGVPVQMAIISVGPVKKRELATIAPAPGKKLRS